MNNNPIDISNSQSIEEIVSLILSLNPKSNLNTSKIKDELNEQLEIKKATIRLTNRNVFDYIIDNCIDSSQYTTVAYDWTPTEVFENINKLVPHNLTISDENVEGTFRNFTVKTEAGTETEFEAETPEDIIDTIFNPLLEKKTDLKIIYPNGNKHSREVHMFFLVKRNVADKIEKSPIFIE